MAPECKSTRFSRRAFAAGAAAASVAAGLAARGAAAQDATPAPTPHALVGAWRVDATLAGVPGSRAVRWLVAADGTMAGTVPPTMAGFPGMGPVLFVSGVSGAWTADGPNGAAVTFDMQIADEAGTVLGYFTIRGTAALGADGQTLQGTYTTTITDPAGTATFLGPGTVSGTRIAVEPMELPPPGTPAATSTPAS